MKIAAITDNGTREKDFVDIAFFSTKYSLKEMLNFYETKYKGISTVSAIKALKWFDDIQRNEPVNLLVGKYDWNKIEKRLDEMVKNPEIKFSEFPIWAQQHQKGIRFR